MDRRRWNRPMRAEHERWLLRVFVVFALGCVLGTLAGWIWPAGLSRNADWTLRLTGERVAYGRLLLQALRYPVFLCVCASARRCRRLALPALCLRGLTLSWTVGCLLQSYGLRGLFLALSGQFFCGLLQLPLLFSLALRCFGRRPVPLDGAVLRLIVGILFLCALCAALDYWVSPVGFSFLLWVGR